MLRQIKYRLLRWLLDDICEKSICESCCIGGVKKDINAIVCFENDVFVQARKVWGLEE